MAATTWNPSDKNANITLSNGNLTAKLTGNGGQWNTARATNSFSSGKYYYEATLDAFPSPSGTAPTGFGLANSTQSLANNQFLGVSTNSVGWYLNNGNQFYNNAGTTGFPTGVAGDVIAFGVDFDNFVVYAKNVTQNTFASVGDIADTSLISGALFPGVSFDVLNAQLTANFGASAFTGTPFFDFAPGWDGTVPVALYTQWAPYRSDGNFSFSGTYGNVATCTAGGGATWHRCQASTFYKTGKYYAEFVANTIPAGGQGNGTWGIGISRPQLAYAAFIGSPGNTSIGYYPISGNVIRNGSTVSTIQTGAAGDTICMAVDFGNKRIWFRTNGGNWNNSSSNDPAANTGGIDITGIMTSNYTFGPSFCGEANTSKTTANFGVSPFSRTVPSGFLGWTPPVGINRGHIFG